jgi:hypothetical protein
VLAVYFDGKWFFSNTNDQSGAPPDFGYNLPILTIIPCIYNNQPTLYAILGTVGAQYLIRLFDDYSRSPPSSFMTALWAMDDPLADKQVIRAGFEAIVQQIAGGFTATLDTSDEQTAFNPTAPVEAVSWINNSGRVVTWQNNALQTVIWFDPGLLLYNATAPYTGGKYVGMSVEAPSSASGSGSGVWAAVYELNGVYMDYEMRARW